MPDLRLGRYQDVLADVRCDALICDPPYGARVHKGHDSAAKQVVGVTGQKTRRDLSYAHWTPEDVIQFVEFWAPRTRGWMFCMTSDDLIGVWRDAYERAGRLSFAPVALLMYHPRLLGDGPGSGVIYCMASRPRKKEFVGGWSNPPWYGPVYPATEKGQMHIGGKPLHVMREVVRDYSRRGNVVCDPCAGGATTLLAAAQEGRKAVGAEVDPVTFERAQIRLEQWRSKEHQQPKLFDFNQLDLLSDKA